MYLLSDKIVQSEQTSSFPTELREYEWLEQLIKKKQSGLLYGLSRSGKTHAAKTFSKNNKGVIIYQCRKHPSFNAICKSLLVNLGCSELESEDIAELTIAVVKEKLESRILDLGIETIIFDDFIELTNSQWLKLVKYLKKIKVNFIAIDTCDRENMRSRISQQALCTFQSRFEVKGVFPFPAVLVPNRQQKLVHENVDMTLILKCLIRKENKIVAQYKRNDICPHQLVDDRKAAATPLSSFLPKGITQVQVITNMSMSAAEIAEELSWFQEYTSPEGELLPNTSRVKHGIAKLLSNNEVVKLNYTNSKRYITRSKYNMFD